MSNSGKTNKEFLLGIFLPIVFILLLSSPVLFVAIFVSKTFLNILVEFLLSLILPIIIAYVSYGLMAFEIHRRGTPVDLWADRKNQIPIIATYWEEIGRHSRFPVLIIIFFLSILFMVSLAIFDAVRKEQYGVVISIAGFLLIYLQMVFFINQLKKIKSSSSGLSINNHNIFYAGYIATIVTLSLTLLYLYYRYIDVYPLIGNVILHYIFPIFVCFIIAYSLYLLSNTSFEIPKIENGSIVITKTWIVFGWVRKKKIEVNIDDIEKIKIITHPMDHFTLTSYLPEYESTVFFPTNEKKDFLEKIRAGSKRDIPIIEEAFSEEKNLKMVKLFIVGLLFIVLLAFVVIYLATMHLQ